MLYNYVLIGFRNLAKHKVFSLINISGMAISLASCLLIALFVADEMAYDRHHVDGDRTFRIYNIVTIDGNESARPIVPFPFAASLERELPEVEDAVRVMDTYESLLFERGDVRTLEAQGISSEGGVFDMLSLQLISGDAATALNRELKIVLSKTLAEKYFGNSDPVGQVMKVDGVDREITGVFVDPPQHFHLNINFLLSFSEQLKTNFENNWQRQEWITYIKLKQGVDHLEFERKLIPWVETNAYPAISKLGFTYVPHLQNIKDIHLHSSNFEWEIAQRGNAQSVYILIVTSAMILLIAALNFINLSTARAVKRMKEVGIRKTAGAHKHQLVFQFVAEAIFVTMVSLVLALILSQTALPFLNEMVGKQLAMPITWLTFLGGVGFCVVLGLLSGGYPALLMSAYRPAMALTTKSHAQGGTAVLRQSLVVLQFMLSIFLITGSWIVLSQNNLLQTKNLGFKKDNVVVIPLREPQLRNHETTKRLYSQHPNVVSATLGFGLPGDIIAGDQVINPETGAILPSNLLLVDYDYIETLGMEMASGRAFSSQFATDSTQAFIINETAAKAFGFGSADEAIGRRLNWSSWTRESTVRNGNVIGVVKDFHFRSLRDKVTPVVMVIFPRAAWKIALRIKPEGTEQTITHFKQTFESLDPEWSFSYSFLDENFDAMYKSEVKLGALFSIFTYLAIGVACLGLFGLVEFSVNQKTKEISIRKVMGASISSLIMLLTRRYFLLLSIAFLLIVPVSYYAAEKWLNLFAYRIDLEVWTFVKALLMVGLITAVTVSFQSIAAAMGNPVKYLRND
jgi:putative ABC transport system permease protein